MQQREVLIGVCGGIAAYKIAMVVSRLAQSAHGVSTILTEAACQFVGPATFAALTGRPTAMSLFDPAYPLGAHIELAARADLLCIAPATANILSAMATGRADDLLSTTYLCFEGPVVVAPAMNCQMWESRAVQRNLQTLRDDGAVFVEPESGWLSCRQQGVGRMAEPDEILRVIAQQLDESIAQR